MRLSDLLGVQVRTESGESLGHVHDLRAEIGAGAPRVTGVVVGQVGLLERLGLGASASTRRLRRHDVIAWTDVLRADRRGVVVREGAERR